MARKLAEHGRQIADYLRLLSQGRHRWRAGWKLENDPRLNEIVANLDQVVNEARIR